MIAFPNAKINIGLQVVERLPDTGYHRLLTVFRPVGWCDILELTPDPSLRPGEASLTVSGLPCDCPPEKNLVMRAFHAVDDLAGPLPGTAIHLRKVIPDGAGLGGGSADAAFTARMLREMYTLDLTDAELALAMSRLGADCPFFIYDVPMVAEGIGDELTAVSLDLTGWDTVLLKPDVHVSTREAYAGVTPRGIADPEMVETILHRPPTEWSGRVVNDFEPSVFAAHPELPALKQQLLDAGAAYAAMSGSGSTIYGLFRHDDVPPGWRSASTLWGCRAFIC